jgi:hypothetical protein
MAFQINGTTVINDSAGEAYGISKMAHNENAWQKKGPYLKSITSTDTVNLTTQGLAPTNATGDENWTSLMLMIEYAAGTTGSTFSSNVTIRFDGDDGSDTIVIVPSNHVITSSFKVQMHFTRWGSNYPYKLLMQLYRTPSNASYTPYGWELENPFNANIFGSQALSGASSAQFAAAVIAYPTYNAGTINLNHTTYWN